MGRRDDLPTVHMIFEEASTITVQELHLGIIRLRKTRNPVLYLSAELFGPEGALR